MKLKKFNFKTVNSTNDAAIRIIKKTNYKFGIIVAETQKKGRGQYGKKWISNKGNLFVSIFFPINNIKFSLKELTKMNCLLVKKLISKYYKGKILIKIPNDLLIDSKKISGILQETFSDSGKVFMIVGIGINLIKNPNLKDYPTTNLYNLINVKISSNNAVFNLKKIYEKFIPLFDKFDLKNINRI